MAVSTITDMLASINRFHDLQRESRFVAYFPNIPSCCGTVGGQELRYRCEALDLPGRSFTTFDHRTYGPIVKYPTQTNFGEITLTFLCTSNRIYPSNPSVVSNQTSIPYTGMQEKVIFENWMNYINPYPKVENPDITYAYHNFRYKNESSDAGYAKTLILECYSTDHMDTPSYKMTFEGCYPTMVYPVSMRWASEEVARLTVTFTYDYYRDSGGCECAPEIENFVINTQPTPPARVTVYEASQEEEDYMQSAFGGARPPPSTPVPGARPSDRRLTKNIEYLETTNFGINLYKFQYIWSDETYVGVIAQEIQDKFPSAVVSSNGYYMVDYEMLGLKMIKYENYKNNQTV